MMYRPYVAFSFQTGNRVWRIQQKRFYHINWDDLVLGYDSNGEELCADYSSKGLCDNAIRRMKGEPTVLICNMERYDEI